MLQLKTVNRELKKLGSVDELVKGDGYFYFAGETSLSWSQCSVYVNSINQLTLDEWIEEYNSLKMSTERTYENG